MALKLLATVTNLRRPLWALVADESGALDRKWVVSGHEMGDVEVHIDLDKLVRELGRKLGRKVLESKSGLSKRQGGTIFLRIINRRRNDAEPEVVTIPVGNR